MTVNQGGARGSQVVVGGLCALVMGLSVVVSAAMRPGDVAFGLFGVVVVPFVVALLATRRVSDALVLVWLNEIFFGLSGSWVQIGPIPGRGALLLAVVGLYAVGQLASPDVFTRIRGRSLTVLAYGIALPILLFLYSTAVRHQSTRGAFSDVMRFGTLLIYFPLRDTLRRRTGVCIGWSAGAVALLAGLIVTAATGPLVARRPVSDWLNGTDPWGVMARSDADFTRVAITSAIFCYLGVFLGLVVASDAKTRRSIRFLGGLLATAALAPFIVNFVRGQLLGVVGGLAFLGVLNVTAHLRWRSLLRIAVLTVAFVGIGYWVSTALIPVSLTKWDIRGMNWRDVVDPVRIEQTERMLQAWLEAPVFGLGVGAPLRGYSRTGEAGGLAFEVQYPMVLYRVGVVGFVVLMLPFGWLVLRTTQLWRAHGEITRTAAGQLQSAIACSVVALLTAAWMNPYLATVFTPFLFAFFLAADDARSRVARAA